MMQMRVKQAVGVLLAVIAVFGVVSVTAKKARHFQHSPNAIHYVAGV